MLGREDSASSSTVPKSIGERYTLERIIGRGGMGVVWEARHRALNTVVAIKLLQRAAGAQTVARRRFEAEAQITAQLKTRHAVQIFDFGVTDDGQPYLVMERLDGESLAQRLTRVGRIEPAITAQYLRQAARALDRAHARGIVHRDFKPENIFVTRDEEGREQVKVMDFGVAKLMGELEAVDPTPADAHDVPVSAFTRTGMLLGTPCYMAPEQITSRAELGPRADVWALGVVAYECLTGKLPFDGADLRSLFDRIARGERARASDVATDLPPSFDSWFDRTCAIDPAARYASAGEAAAALALALGVPTQGKEFRLSSPEGSLPPPHPAPSESDPRAFAPTVEMPTPGATLGGIPWTRSVEASLRPPRRARVFIGAALACALAIVALFVGIARSHANVASAPRTIAQTAAAAGALTAPPPPLARHAAEAEPLPRVVPELAADSTRARARTTHRVAPPQPVPVVAPPAPSAATAAPVAQARKATAFDLPPLGL